jgi:hypothetical protein
MKLSRGMQVIEHRDVVFYEVLTCGMQGSFPTVLTNDSHIDDSRISTCFNGSLLTY